MPNIDTKYDEHQLRCNAAGNPGDRAGDVRVCSHGKIQINYGILVTQGGFWETLSPIFHPIKYARAKKALLHE